MGKPVKSAVTISDDEIRASLDKGQLRLLDERGIDVMLFSPMASAMGHHFGNALISRYWTEVNNDLIHRACKLYPGRFAGVCSLPQSPGVSPRDCAQELERCVNEFGFVGCNLNPDPSGGYWTGPPLGDEWWYPLVRTARGARGAGDDPRVGHVQSRVPHDRLPLSQRRRDGVSAVDGVARLPRLSDGCAIVMPHGGGNVPYQAARYRALAIMNKWEPFDDFVKRIYFDTTVYNQDAMELLIKVAGVDNIIFASEMLGGVNTIDPASGKSFDDNRRFIDAISWLSEADRQKIFETNARKVYARLGVTTARA